MTTTNTEKTEHDARPVITLEPPWYRCENGNEFRCSGRPKRCPVCGSTNIEIVPEIASQCSPR